MNQVAETANAAGRNGFKSALSRTFRGVKRNRVEQTQNEVEAKWIGDNGVKLAHPRDCAALEKDVAKALKEHCTGQVCEIGCGTGRIAGVFDPSRYLGLDINPVALEVAEKARPRHKFDLIMWDTLYPGADTYLFFTVLMHIPDNKLFGIIRRTEGRVVVAESMGRWIRDYGRGNNYQRDPAEYRRMFSDIGLREVAFVHALTFHFPYFMDIMVFE